MHSSSRFALLYVPGVTIESLKQIPVLASSRATPIITREINTLSLTSPLTFNALQLFSRASNDPNRALRIQKNIMSDPLVSHGRGGAANIGKDSTPYTDGEIVREGPVGDQGDGPYSSGVCALFLSSCIYSCSQGDFVCCGMLNASTLEKFASFLHHRPS